MSEKKARGESDKATLSRVRKELAGPRMARSTRKWRADRRAPSDRAGNAGRE